MLSTACNFRTVLVHCVALITPHLLFRFARPPQEDFNRHPDHPQQQQGFNRQPSYNQQQGFNQPPGFQQRRPGFNQEQGYNGRPDANQRQGFGRDAAPAPRKRRQFSVSTT